MCSRAAINIDALEDRLSGDTELLDEVIDIFLERCVDIMAVIQRAITSGDTRALETSARRLRGYLSGLNAERASDVALQLEIKGRRFDRAGICYLYSKLQEEIELVQAALGTMRKSRMGEMLNEDSVR